MLANKMKKYLINIQKRQKKSFTTTLFNYTPLKKEFLKTEAKKKKHV